MVSKLDIMNSRENETWEMVNGKIQRIEEEKVTGPTVQSGIKEVEIKETATPKRTEIVITEKKEEKKKSKKKRK